MDMINSYFVSKRIKMSWLPIMLICALLVGCASTYQQNSSSTRNKQGAGYTSSSSVGSTSVANSSSARGSSNSTQSVQGSGYTSSPSAGNAPVANSSSATAAQYDGSSSYTQSGQGSNYASSPSVDDAMLYALMMSYLQSKQVSSSSSFGSDEDTDEIDFLNCEGKWSIYIDKSEDYNIYSWSGTPLAYVDEDLNIYGFNGKYLGWIEGAIMYDTDGEPFACTENAYNGYTPYKPYKGYQKYAPYKSYQQYAKYRPYTKNRFSGIDAELYLRQGMK